MAKFYMMAKYTPEALKGFMSKPTAVSYTHLTLPTILLV